MPEVLVTEAAVWVSEEFVCPGFVCVELELVSEVDVLLGVAVTGVDVAASA